MPDTLADWLTYLESLHPKSIALGLERVEKVRRRLNLQANFPIITVGGTNGKGSVCAILESILHAAGYRVGCYTSPHLLEYNERVRISKNPATNAELCASFEKIELARCYEASAKSDESGLDRVPGKNTDLPVQLTYFEFGTLAAMQCFIEHKVDVAILEVGLGGRLDAVNIFDSDCAIVTSVDIDHTDYLGATREQISFEKAGIFRAGKVAIFGDRDIPEAIINQAQQVGAILWKLGGEFTVDENSPCSPADHAGVVNSGHIVHTISILPSATSDYAHRRESEPKQWKYSSLAGTRSSLPYPALRGDYQLNNVSAALAALDALKHKLPVSMEAVRRGLVEVSLYGRFQILPGDPQIILDVAHNPHAAGSLARNLANLPPCKKTFAVFAMLKDKDIAGVVRAIKQQVDVWLVAGIDAPRGATAAEIAAILASESVAGEVREITSIANAFQLACNEASKNDRIAVFGSFYTVAEVMRVRGLRHA
jgi:dihydrofolate synthase/folylpolyglutamate synthase